ncbi:tRNA lysidine(34) synthetase TilS [Siminovitchia sediminis]|uniref:tRNA(Ile)-lysidine synthase n=1 Tax=Siminovitchia sediminis TaxID=1274353 RepID=A0ABW4KFB5_9BACI
MFFTYKSKGKDGEMPGFNTKIMSFIEKHGLLRRGDFVVAAVSGGPDSMAMLDFLVKRQDMYGIRLAVAHVDHMLRGEESVQDLEYVRSYCDHYGLELKAASIDVKQKMKLEQTGMQETARKYRYRFFASVMEELGANKLAVAQHADDQMETILMRLTRGSSGKARAGMPPLRAFARGKLIRPLLGVTKDEINDYCTFHQLHPRMDPSNEKPAYTRNRFRMDVLPVLKRENQQVHEHFQRFSEDLLEDEAYLEALAEREIRTISRFGEKEVHLDIPSFLQMPLPLQRRGIHLILSYLYQKKIPCVTSGHVQLVGKLLNGENPSGRLDLPLGLHVVRSYRNCIFTFVSMNQETGYTFELRPGQNILLPDGGKIGLKINNELPSAGGDYIILHQNEVKLPLIVRTRRPGDRIKVKGMNGRKKVKDLFIDEKISRSRRDSWPIITDQEGQILWIPGLKKSVYDIGPQCHGHQYILYYTTSGGQQSQ